MKPRATIEPFALCAFLAAGMLAAQPVPASTIGFGNVIPGAGLINKNVVSMRGLRFADMIAQQTDFSCGAAALATLLKYLYRQDVDEGRVMEGMLKVSDAETVRNRGFSLLDMKNYVQTLGMRGRGYAVKLEQLEHTRIPTVVLLDVKGYRHFVVLKKVTPDKAYVGDPALGNRVLARDEFAQSWNGVVFAVIGRGLDRESALLYPKDPYTARKLMTTLTPLTNTELLDFGFTHADLF